MVKSLTCVGLIDQNKFSSLIKFSICKGSLYKKKKYNNQFLMSVYKYV